MRSLSLVTALAAATVSLPAHAAQPAMPAQPLSLATPGTAQPLPAIPQPADKQWPGGTMTLDIDASDVTRGVYRVRQQIPIAPGTAHLTLLYPEWLPGKHAPRGPVAELVDLRLSADGRPVSWTRDPVDVHAFHVDLPAGARMLEARFIHTSPLKSNEGRITMTREMLNLQWEKMSLYPAGHFVRRIAVKPTVTLPQGWLAAAALDGARVTGSRVTWDTTDYETLVDSPIFAGQFFRTWDIGNTVSLNVVADTPDLIRLDDARLAKFSALTDEAMLTFGDAPFDRYEFLVALTDRMGGIGLEHLRSSENQMEPLNFVEWDGYDWDRNVIAHELVHAWNGKFRRPAKLWTPDYRTPMQDNLLWVYEGQTQFWGWVLAARSGLQTRETVLGMIASRAAAYADSPGRAWRSVEDTTLDPIIAARKPKPYDTLARGEDYYSEGALVWLEADQVIREGTGGQRGLDDFARLFFAHRQGDGRVKTYEFGDVVAALGQIYAHDWKTFLEQRISRPGRPAPFAGIEMAGYRLAWKDRPNPYDAARSAHLRNLDLGYSLGISVGRDGEVDSTRWGSPAFDAGLVTGTEIVAVDSMAYSPELLSRAVARAAGGNDPIELIVRRGDRYRTLSIPYYGGLRWPWLERKPGAAQAGLDRLLSPRSNSMTR
jgi:predicted metalloprotease with PDZ domain